MLLLRPSLRLSLSQRSFSSTHHKLAQTQTHKPYYITTPIFYPNAEPHIGHLYSLVIGDVFARYHRLQGRDVNFLAGTDEHGLKIQKASRAWSGGEGNEKAFCDSLSERFRDLAKKAEISNTCFLRTSDAMHHRTVQDIWRKLNETGLIYKGNYAGWYSITDECFYTESQVIRLPDHTVSIETGAVVEWTSEENYMFRLSAFRDALIAHYTSNPNSIHPPQYHQDILQLLEGLADISISRPRSRLSWGVEVPGDPDQTVYVWFDALLIYLTGAGYPWSARYLQERQGWPADLQIIGKDILRFHAIYLPAILLGLSSIPLPSRLLAHAHWTVSQKKMSKSLGNVADPLDAMEKWGVDGVRFYLIRVGGRWRDDVDWSEDQVDKHVKEIRSQLGNYFLRITSPKLAIRAKEASSLLASHSTLHPLNVELKQMVQSLPEKIKERMDALEAGEALDEIMSVLRVANKSLSTLAPWSPTCPALLVHETRQVAFEMLKVVSKFIGPFMPGIERKLEDALSKGGEDGEVKGVRLF
ncbi:hypothetical protein BYT27DRAFT_7111528 [Phlegmacium glaucopus]|nr:hypothetical protein BYT27DRAFT_7111528 [Phlegmacium glaucopus]